MPSEIGVLELEIRDNSKNAGQGLNQLADALVRVQTAVGNGLKMSNISRSLNTFAQAVQGNSKTLSNVGTFLSAMEKYQKAFQGVNNVKFNSQPIKDLKEAVGDGVKLGQAGTQLNGIRTALEGEWKTDNAYQAGLALSAIGKGAKSLDGTNLATKAKNISAVAKALEEYATASSHVLSALGKDGSSSGSLGSIESILGGKSRYPVNLGQFGTRRGSKKSEGQIGMDLESMVPGLEHVSSTVQTANESVEQFRETVVETKSVVTEHGGNDMAAPFDAVSEKIRMATDNLIKFNNMYARMAESAYGNTPGNVPSGMELSTYIAPPWKPNWTYYDQDYADQYFSWKPDFEMVGEAYVNFVTELDRRLAEMADTMGWFAKEGFRLGAGSSPLLLGGGSTALSTHVEQPWKPNWTFHDANAIDFSKTDQFINGEGLVTIHDEVSAAQEYADAFERVVATRQEEFEIADRIRREQEAAFYGNGQNGNNVVDNSYEQDITWLNGLVEGASEIDLLNMRLESMRDRLYEGATSGRMSGEQIANLIGQIQDLQARIDDLVEAQRRLSSFNGILSRGWDELKKGIQGLFPTLSNLVKRFGQIVKYRMLRTVLKHITSGFSEGVKNVYQYSKAVGTDLAPAMDQAATALQQMKNSIGAAAAPVIQALVPVLQNVVNWFINLINYANQFFALLNGQSTWTRALPEQAEAFEKSTKSAKGASKAMKDLLADWDELNIIQSQSGGGGGSSSGKTAEEYKNMFEEVNQFDQGIKDALQFIEDHLGGLPGILKKAGAILLGWKFSKAFEGFLGSLGKIVAGGALVSLGVELAYGSGFSAGSKGSWGTLDIIGAIGGSLATAIGGSLITTGFGLGGGIGFAIGLGVGIIATLIGWIEGKNKAADAVKWGNLHMTADQIKDYVKKQFTFDVNAEIDVLHANINDMKGAKDEADTKIAEFEKTLNAAKVNVDMGVDADPNGTTVAEAVRSAQAAVTAVEAELKKTETAVEVGLKYLPHTNNGENVSDDYLSGIMVADQSIRDYMHKMGEDLAEAMLAGEKAGWENGTDLAAIKLMQEQQEIYRKAQEYAKQYEFERKIEGATSGVVKNGVWDRETAEAAFAEQQRLLDEYAAAAREEAMEEVSQLEYFAGLAEAASEKAFEKGQVERGSDLLKSAQELRDLAKSRFDGIDEDIELKLKETKEKIGEQWSELISTVYGEDIGKLVKEKIAHTEYGNGGYYFGYVMDDLLGLGHDTDFGKVLKQGGTAEEVATRIGAFLRSVFADLGNTGVVGYQPPSFINEIIDNFIGNPLSMMDNSAKEQLKQSLIDYFGDEEFANEVYGHLFDIDPEDLKEWIELDKLKDKYDLPTDANGTIQLAVAVEEDSLKEVKEAIEKAMEDGYMSVDESFAIMLKHGFNEYDQAMKELQYNLDEDGYNRGSRPLGGRMIASAGGVSDVGFARVNYNPPTTTTTSHADVATDVANGTARGNETQNGLIQQLIMLCQQIARKDFTVNISPSSDWGRFNARSGRQYNAVTGEEQ